MRGKGGRIRVGIGGWTFDPWEGTFYPEGLAKKRQLEFAGKALQVIEVNGTYYSSQKPETFAKWASEVPDDFVFTLKASRYATNKKVLADAGESVARFLGQGLTELGPKLGPILWQFMPTKRFDAADFAAFLALLPETQDGLVLRHAIEVRHPSFQVEAFVDLARRHNVAIVCADHADYPMIADVTSDFVYTRLQTGSDDVETCYDEPRLSEWQARLEAWGSGGVADGLPLLSDVPPKHPRDVFAFFIHEGKVNAPGGAMEMQKRVG
ncbi:hypothetical protein ASG25_10930 [Rhizobium sp. Leaf384]|uniref:DUF72 domain-containing protein n=1 Tax=unclassified Rhizobium TaxID=2613769 RepID=UPI000712736C|nr:MULTISPECIES: DUF72 domain-containing protein [unclassified Rhizobium]KQS79090.1 hypothetical protein ASG25_10930 [Rhizobium sp. Leaf384]KQS82657.1 hypothetical protein ASG58_04745 [Rhizobium sp. Leaf383]